MFRVFACCLPRNSYTRVPECPGQSEKGMTTINAFSSRVISCVVAMENFAGDKGTKNPLVFEKGARICVVEKANDHFVGFLESDPMKVLGNFPAEICQVDRAWLAEKFTKGSVSSDSDSEDEAEMKSKLTRLITKEPGTCTMNSSKFVEIEV
ncbi:hypothetical protein K493DRAFT_314856 [Basidiobolus meristosporus CBS 931.73]|uniref:SH3 domain-containing protein n=1 Tax=Basidiobolus meristosporus CBS 931.73 TaxID=1314790 RepID=A0A1Y1YCX6_9FUNG|nr:hypothetical protein K493DRAFT_314856 [Basidiobolus meristosporus CBS 931.73]|eukprot:ORX95783.1 hypothetical protein K493DRAFT_314856 [Basidiobolus meristosporus CBS 931.73]